MARYFPSKMGFDDDDSQEEVWEDIQFNREPKADPLPPTLRFNFEDGPSSSNSILPGPSQERQEHTRPFKKTTDPRLIKRRRCPTPPRNEDIPASASPSKMEEEQPPQNTPEDSKAEDFEVPSTSHRPHCHADEASASTSTSTSSQSDTATPEPRERNILEEIPPFEFEIPIEFDIVTDDEEERPPFVVGELRSVTLASRRRRRPLRSDSDNYDPHCRRNLRKMMPCLYCHMWRHGIKSYRTKLRNAKMMLRIIKEMIRTRQEAMQKE